MSVNELILRKTGVTKELILAEPRDEIGQRLAQVLRDHSSGYQIALISSLSSQGSGLSDVELKNRVREYVADVRRDVGTGTSVRQAESMYIELLQNYQGLEVLDAVRLRMKLGACAEMRGSYFLANQYYSVAYAIGSESQKTVELSMYSRLRSAIISQKSSPSNSLAEEIIESCKPLLDTPSKHFSNISAMEKYVSAYLFLGQEDQALDALNYSKSETVLHELRVAIAECKFLIYLNDFDSALQSAENAKSKAVRAGLEHKCLQIDRLISRIVPNV